jgi:hypothetical protein
MSRRAARPIRTSRTAPRSFREDGWRALISPERLIAVTLILVTAGGILWLATSRQFALAADGVEISGVHYTDALMVREALNLPADGAPNVFGLHTDAMRRALLTLPAVTAADVHVALPNHLVVRITERTAVLRVIHDGFAYLVDGEGMVLDARDTRLEIPADLPVIEDQRVDLAIAYQVGQLLDPSESAAMLQIGALTPALVGSNAAGLGFSATDAEGFVVTADPDGWRAVFGFYTPTLRPPTQIAQQVQCLRSLLATGEAQIQTIYLAPSNDRCGTYLPRESPGPT